MPEVFEIKGDPRTLFVSQEIREQCGGRWMRSVQSYRFDNAASLAKAQRYCSAIELQTIEDPSLNFISRDEREVLEKSILRAGGKIENVYDNKSDKWSKKFHFANDESFALGEQAVFKATRPTPEMVDKIKMAIHSGAGQKAGWEKPDADITAKLDNNELSRTDARDLISYVTPPSDKQIAAFQELVMQGRANRNSIGFDPSDSEKLTALSSHGISEAIKTARKIVAPKQREIIKNYEKSGLINEGTVGLDLTAKPIDWSRYKQNDAMNLIKDVRSYLESRGNSMEEIYAAENAASTGADNQEFAPSLDVARGNARTERAATKGLLDTQAKAAEFFETRGSQLDVLESAFSDKRPVKGIVFSVNSEYVGVATNVDNAQFVVVPAATLGGVAAEIDQPLAMVHNGAEWDVNVPAHDNIELAMAELLGKRAAREYIGANATEAPWTGEIELGTVIAKNKEFATVASGNSFTIVPVTALSNKSAAIGQTAAVTANPDTPAADAGNAPTKTKARAGRG